MRERVIRFEVFNPEVNEHEGIFRSTRSWGTITNEENDKLEDMSRKLPIPKLQYEKNNYEHFFRVNGIKEFKELVRLLLKVNVHGKNIRIRREWIEGKDVAYQDDYQVAILIEPKGRNEENGSSKM